MDMEREKIEELLKQGVGYKEVGKRLEISASKVRSIARERGRGKAQFIVSRSPWRPEEDELASKMLEEGKSVKEIASSLPGRSKQAIYYRNSTVWSKGLKVQYDRIQDGNWTQAEDEQGEALLATSLSPQKVSETLGKTLGSIYARNSTYWRVKLPRGVRKGIWTNDTFFNKWSGESAYLLGFIASDGNVSQDKRCLTIAQSHEDGRLFLEKIKGILGGNITGPDEDDSNRLQIYSRLICARLIELGIVPAKSLIIEMPNVPEEFFRDFIRGLFDGDGCVSAHKAGHGYGRIDVDVRIASGSRLFREQLSKRVQNSIGLLGSSTGIVVRWSHIAGRAFMEWLYEDKERSLYLPRKFEKYQALLAERDAHIDKRRLSVKVMGGE